MNQHLEKGTIVQSAAYHYKIVNILGQGSFGITYLATMEVPGSLGAIPTEVALKEFFMKEINTRNGSSVTGGSTTRDGLFEKYRQKFRHEAENLSLMRHDGVVKVLESFDANGTSYIAMQYLAGGSLDSFIEKRGHLSEKEAIHMTCGIGDALSNMHKHHMLHLDLKPSNVMLNKQGEPVIIDFGLSKQYDESGVPETSTTVGGGTPGYAPLEQASYREGVGFPVTMDIYALGATLFKMLCGHRPPEADKIMNDGFPYDELKGVSRPLVNVVTKAMAFRKADRYQTVDEFIAALQTVNTTDEATSVVTGDSTELEVSGVTLPKEEEKKKELPPKPPTPEKKSNSKIVWIIVSIVAVLLIAGAAVYIVTQNSDSSDVFDDEEYEETEEIDDIEDIKQIDGYVNLGLPSGTLWAEYNEPSNYSYSSAMSMFGNQLPTETQFQELIDYCDWVWASNGFSVTGPNGNTIFLPADGLNVDADVAEEVAEEIGDIVFGCYWTSTPDDNYNRKYMLFLHSDEYNNTINPKIESDYDDIVRDFSTSYVGMSVRLVR